MPGKRYLAGAGRVELVLSVEYNRNQIHYVNRKAGNMETKSNKYPRERE